MDYIVTITTNLEKGRYWQQEMIPVKEEMDAMHAVCLYPELTDQVLKVLAALSPRRRLYRGRHFRKKQRGLIEDYFSTDGLDMPSAHPYMASCDFALGNYTAAGKDTDFPDFERDDRNLIPMIKAAQEASGKSVGLLLSPGARRHG